MFVRNQHFNRQLLRATNKASLRAPKGRSNPVVILSEAEGRVEGSSHGDSSPPPPKAGPPLAEEVKPDAPLEQTPHPAGAPLRMTNASDPRPPASPGCPYATQRFGRARNDTVGKALLDALSWGVIVVSCCGLLLPGSSFAETQFESLDPSKNYKKTATGLYADSFDQNIYEEGVQHLRLKQLFDRLLWKKIRAKDVNVFDEVPDSLFFTNRHGKERFSADELERGANVVGEGLDAGGAWFVTKGKVSGVTPGFFIKDTSGARFLLKLDPPDYPELATSVEVIISKFFHAFGYNVPQYTIVYFDADNLQVNPEATFYDTDGFKKKLTQAKVKEWLSGLPRRPDGRYRAVASKIIPGEILGPLSFEGRRKGDPNDRIPHRHLRVIRALRTFGSFVNNGDLRESNTLDTIVERNGQKIIMHYLIDFGSGMGSMGKDKKPPMSGDEYMIDYGESFKAWAALGFYKKPWQRRMELTGGMSPYPSVGYFSSEEFDPGKWKPLLPYYAFKNQTPADAFWAAKTIMSFTNEDVEAIVNTGALSDEGASRYVTQTLIERRDKVGKYWFSKVAPLDQFKVSSTPGGDYEISFTDLMVSDGLEEAASRRYFYWARHGKIKGEVEAPSFTLPGEWVRSKDSIKVCLTAQTVPNGKKARWLKLELQPAGDVLKVVGIDRGA